MPAPQRFKIKLTLGSKIFILFLLLALSASIAALVYKIVEY